MKMPAIFVLMLVLLAGATLASAHEGEHDAFAAAFAKPIEKAHGLENWRAKKALSFDIQVSFGGQAILKGTAIFDIHSERVRLTTESGQVMVWDGKEAWYTPADAEIQGPRPRFHLRTWTYFLAAPFKLRDPGAHLHELPDAPLREGKELQLKRARLTFGPDIGDAPDDWYVLYRQAGTDRLAAMSYIVTYGNTTEEAEKEPHAIVYSGEQRIDGVILSTKWNFYNWSADRGVHGEPIGEVTITNARFIDPPAGTFEKPDGAARDPLPGK